MRTTRTATGLCVEAQLVEQRYETGLKISAEQMQQLPIVHDDFMPRWNYTLTPTRASSPTSPSDPEVISA